jgi:hypothetical protein
VQACNWDYVGSSGKFDIKNQDVFQTPKMNGGAKKNLNTAYMIDGKIHNRHEMGALIWGGISAKMGISTKALYYTMESAHQVTEGNGEELNEMNMWRMGRTIYGVNGTTPALHYNVKVEVKWSL